MVGSNNIYGQRVEDKGTRMSGELYCANKDFKFLIENNYYVDGSKVYVCPKNLPTNITIVYATNNTPVMSTFSWKINKAISPITINPILLQKNDVVNKKSELEVNFTDPISGQNINLNLDVLTSVSVEFSESAKMYQFDDNNKLPYISSYSGTEKLGTPWNFIENGNLDVLRAESKPKKGFYAINNIMSNSGNLTITPNKLSQSPQNVEFAFSGSGNNILEVKGCDETDPELLLFTANSKSVTVNFIYLCDTDDDDQIVLPGTMVSAATDICIDGGVDLTIDEMNKSGFLKGDDKLVKLSNGTSQVHAGPNLICETTARAKGLPECPINFNIANSISTGNSILNKVGIDLIPGNVSTKYMNYNLFNEDGILGEDELWQVHNQLHGFGTTSESYVYLVGDLGISSVGGNTILGKATGLGKNTMAIDVIDANQYVLVHELGHAKWSLLHPGCPCSSSISGEFGINDYHNFMHGEANNIINWNVRRYQFTKFH